VKRRLVVDELKKLMRAAARASEAVERVGDSGAAADWLYDVIAQTAQKPRDKVVPEARLAELGFDSLMFSELGVALEAAGVDVPEAENLQQIETVADLVKWVEGRPKKKKLPAPRKKKAEEARSDDLHVPKPVVEIGWKVLRAGQRAIYEKIFETKVTGRAHLPMTGPFIVAANHASHLDMGLVKHALGDWGPHLVALAAKDYFFEDRLYRAYFENFTNLIPMDRHGSLRESLRTASTVLKEGHILLIFPEGTRSEDGVLKEFKPSIGFLALANKVDVVPMYLEGTYDALPKGATLPKQRDIAAHIGPVLSWQKLKAASEGLPKSEQYREAARVVENAIRRLGKLPAVPRRAPSPAEGEGEVQP
jgi:long-chain acyl-CoA synthetase